MAKAVGSLSNHRQLRRGLTQLDRRAATDAWGAGSSGAADADAVREFKRQRIARGRAREDPVMFRAEPSSLSRIRVDAKYLSTIVDMDVRERIGNVL
jgi:hypothetical protein